MFVCFSKNIWSSCGQARAQTVVEKHQPSFSSELKHHQTYVCVILFYLDIQTVKAEITNLGLGSIFKSYLMYSTWFI